MGQPVKLSEELVEDARAVVPFSQRSIAGQIEFGLVSENQSKRCSAATVFCRCRRQGEKGRSHKSYPRWTQPRVASESKPLWASTLFRNTSLSLDNQICFAVSRRMGARLLAVSLVASSSQSRLNIESAVRFSRQTSHRHCFGRL